jgi:methionyl-tRNA formyltransferase
MNDRFLVTRKKILFVGSRYHVLDQLLSSENKEDILIYALENSYLAQMLTDKNIAFRAFDFKDKGKFMEEILSLDFDILISNGCPFILPVHKFAPEQLLINIHPTYLPFLQGKTPINGIFYDGYEFYGATMHFIDAGIDTGAIIYQKRVGITPDLDLGLLYHLSMKLEGTVFKIGWELLKQSNFKYQGEKQQGTSTYFNRTPEMQLLDFKSQNTSAILRAIKSFGIKSQGCSAEISNKNYRIYEAENMIHPPLLKEYQMSGPGSLLLEYETKLLVKTKDGIIKITRYEVLIG